MKQSVWLVILQVISILVGFVSTFYIASNISSNVFAIVGVYSVISSIMSVFSNTGIETYAVRNILMWNEKMEFEKTKKVVTEAIIFRLQISTILVLPMFFYSLFISHYKYDDNYLGLFILMSIFGVFKSLNDSLSLLLQAFNKYFIAALSTQTVNVFGQIICLIIYQQFGFSAYILSLMMIPMVISLPLIGILWKWLDLRYVKFIPNFFYIIRSYKYYTLTSYFRFGIKHLDLFLVSVLLPPSLMGSYTLMKKVESMINIFFANIFDPFIQKLTQLKSRPKDIVKKLVFAFKLQYSILSLFIVLTVVMSFFIDDILLISGLSSYPYLKYFFILILLSESVLLLFKVRYLIVATFYSPKQNFVLTFVYSLSMIVSFFVVVMFLNHELLFSFLLLSNVITLFYVYRLVPNLKRVYRNIIVNIES